MSDAFAAIPGTMLVRLDPEAERGFVATPIIGCLTTKGTRVAPLTAQAPIPIQHGVAIVVPGNEWIPEMVNDPTYRLTFDGVEEWMSFVDRQDPDSTPTVSSHQPHVGTLPWVVFDESKTFVKTSYWHFKDGSDEFVFEVAGGDLLPNDSRVVRSNRKDFLILKKTIPVVDAAALTDGDIPDPEDGPEIDEEAEDLI